ncbi:hypothetical protein GGE65_008387 [Skermanella aerolata]
MATSPNDSEAGTRWELVGPYGADSLRIELSVPLNRLFDSGHVQGVPA